MSEQQPNQGDMSEIMKEVLPKSTAPEQPKEDNPSVTPSKRVTEETRIPMSTRTLKLEVPELAGYHLHWAVDTRVARMLRAGYERVMADEVDLTNLDIAGDRGASGNADMGSGVSVAAGESVESGRLILMKLRNDWWDADCKRIEAENEKIAAGLRGGTIGMEGPGDQSNRYNKLKEGQELFIPRNKRRFKNS